MAVHSSDSMKEFVEGLKEAYMYRQMNNEEQWPPVRGNKLINLVLVEADKADGFRAGLPQHGACNDKVKRTPIFHGDLFKVEGKRPVRKVIVEGNAGIGKTTLCTMLTEQWANGEILTQFDCVLLLPLRDQLVASASSLPDLLTLYHPDKIFCESVVQQLKKTKGKSVLIIADGWDELSGKNRSLFLFNVLFGHLLPSASVLLTSRPSASASFHNLPTVDCLVEVVGFNEENVKQYIESEFDKYPEKASSLIEYLKSYPVIQSVCSVPLNCAIVCYLWAQHTLDRALPKALEESDIEFPKMLTELYTQIVLNVVLHNLKKQNLHEGLISLSFDTIPGELCDMFWLTCEFAFECLVQDKIVFSQEELVSSFSTNLDMIMCLGLLQYARSLLPVGQGLSFHFAHLTIQEFLAALHLVTLPSEQKLKVCEKNALSDRFDMVWGFVFGLGCKKKKFCSEKVMCLEDEMVDKFLSIVSVRSLTLCYCSMESSIDRILSSKVSKKINGIFEGPYLNSIAYSPYDYVAFFYVLRHMYTSDSTGMHMTININLSNLSSYELTDKPIRKLSDILSSADGALQVRSLSLYDNKLTDESVTNLLSGASASFRSLECIDLTNNRITNITPLFSHCYCNSLLRITLSHNPLGKSGIRSLETAVTESKLHNLEWLLLSNTLTDDAHINGELLTTLLPAIASHCPRLMILDLSRNNLSAPGASALDRPLFAENSMLDLGNTNINASAVKKVTAAIKFCKTSSVILNDNPLGSDGLNEIFKILKSKTCPITDLDLCNTDLTTPVNTESQCHNIQPPNTDSVLNSASTLSSCQAFKNSTLTFLYLNGNNFSGKRVSILAEFVHQCKSLKWLYCLRCSLTSSAIKNFLDHLEKNSGSHKNLKMWYLRNNSINDIGAKALSDSVPKLFPSIQKISLSCNPVSDVVMKRLKDVIETNWKEQPSQSEKLLKLIWNDDDLEDMHYKLIMDSPSGGNYKNIYKSKELDEPVKPHSTATDESNPPTVQSPHKMDQQETMSSDGTSDVTTPPQTTPSPHGLENEEKVRAKKHRYPELTLNVLDGELSTLTKPIQFGIKLGIPQRWIEVIQQDHHHDTEGQKTALFQHIAKNHKSLGITWSSIADALRDIHGDLSLRIREQCCSPEKLEVRMADVTTPPQTTPSPHVYNRAHTEKVGKHRPSTDPDITEGYPQPKKSRLDSETVHVTSKELDEKYITKLNTVSKVCTTDVTTPQQTNPTPHSTLSGVCGPKTYHEEQKAHTGKVKKHRHFSDPDIIKGYPQTKKPKLSIDPETAHVTNKELDSQFEINREAFDAFATNKTKTDIVYQTKCTNKISFVKPVKVLEVSCRGDKYCDDSLGLCIDVPEGAVPKGFVLQLEIGVCLFGPFKFPGDSHPIAPILMVRPQNYDFQLKKSLRIALPHMIEDANDSDVDNLGIQVIKANHTGLKLCTVYKFDPIIEDGTVHFSSSGDKGCIEFSLSHFCFVTVRTKESKKTAERIGYCVCPLLPPRTTVESGTTFTYYLCVTYFMAPFIEAIKDQFFLKKSYELDKSKIIRFKFIGENNFIQAKVQNTQQCWKVSLYSANYEGIQKIHADLVDLWKKEEDVLKLEIENLMYPPSFQVIAIGQKTTSPSFVTVDFSLSEQPSFSISLPLPLESSHFSLNNSQDSTQSQPMTITSLLCSGKVNKDQLSREVKESDLPLLAEMFNDPSSFLNHFGLTRASKGDVKALISQIGNQAAMQKILELWWQMNPPQATFEKLLNIVLSEKRGDIALDICTHLKQSE